MEIGAASTGAAPRDEQVGQLHQQVGALNFGEPCLRFPVKPGENIFQLVTRLWSCEISLHFSSARKTVAPTALAFLVRVVGWVCRG